MSTTPSPSPTRITTAEGHVCTAHCDGDPGHYVPSVTVPDEVLAAPPVSDPAAPTITPDDTTALVAKLRNLIEDLIDPDDCWFDHHGGCQAHGYLNLGYDNQQCPHAEAKEWLESTAALGLTVTDKADR